MSASPNLWVPRRGGLIKRVFAWMMSREGDGYDLNIEKFKRDLLGDLHGLILEIGPGTGPNLRFFPTDVEWVGVEPNPFMIPYLEQAIRNLGRPAANFRIEPGEADGSRLPVEDDHIEAVVSTMVLCSVPDPKESLQEILRVLRPGGRFVFIEHVAAAPGSRLRWVQDKIQPLWSVMGDGCHPNRETWKLIESVGFETVQIEHFRYTGGGLVSPLIAGTAFKPG